MATVGGVATVEGVCFVDIRYNNMNDNYYYYYYYYYYYFYFYFLLLLLESIQ